jgi:hypothetical protein
MKEDLTISGEQIEELRKSGAPLVVRVDGEEVIVQDAAAYRRLIRILDEIDVAESARVCARRWEAMRSGGDAGVSASEFIAELRDRLRPAG